MNGVRREKGEKNPGLFGHTMPDCYDILAIIQIQIQYQNSQYSHCCIVINVPKLACL